MYMSFFENIGSNITNPNISGKNIKIGKDNILLKNIYPIPPNEFIINEYINSIAENIIPKINAP